MTSVVLFLALSAMIAQVPNHDFSYLIQNESTELNSDSTIKKRICATPLLSEKYETWLQEILLKQTQFANKKKASSVYTIPVIFHIIHEGEAIGSGRNISQALIDEQITILNNDYRNTNSDFNTWVTQTDFLNTVADCEITFCAALLSPSGTVLVEPGIDRINRNTKGWTGPGYPGFNASSGYVDNTIKTGSYWDPTKYFNIWVLQFTDGVLGYAQLPQVPNGTIPITDLVGLGGNNSGDGVVLDYRVIGSNGNSYPGYTPYNKGRTATHEIGHWLGLWHINGNSSCGNDYVADTPTQNNLSSTCPSVAGSVVNSGCTASSNPPGRMYQNFMDYSDDKCAVMFTNDQKARVQACMANCVNRLSLNTSTVCSNPLSIEENKSILNLNVYPNPSTGELFIDVSTIREQNINIHITNILGQSIKELKYSSLKEEVVKIDLSNEPKGMYFITLASKFGLFSKRIISE